MNMKSEKDKDSKHKRPLHPVLEGALYMVVMMFIVLAVIQIVVPNNWITVTNTCRTIFDDFNSTRWYSGGYSQDDVAQVNECYRRLSS